MVDWMIAAVAWRHQATVLVCDAGLDHVARIIGIDVDDSSPYQ
jgi:predicted nucleic acid-binding protein